MNKVFSNLIFVSSSQWVNSRPRGKAVVGCGVGGEKGIHIQELLQCVSGIWKSLTWFDVLTLDSSQLFCYWQKILPTSKVVKNKTKIIILAILPRFSLNLWLTLYDRCWFWSRFWSRLIIKRGGGASVIVLKNKWWKVSEKSQFFDTKAGMQWGNCKTLIMTDRFVTNH